MVIQFFDITPIDREQLEAALNGVEAEVYYETAPLSPDRLNPAAVIVSPFVSSAVGREAIDALPNLKLVACRSTGFNNVDLTAAAAHGVVVANVPSYGDHTVAEYAFTLLLALSRRLPATLQAVQRRVIDPTALTGFDLKGKTIGLVGAGRIGQAMARLARGAGMHLIAYDPFPRAEVAEQLGLEFVDFGRLLEESDVISVHSPYTGDNRHLFNAEAFSNVKPGLVFINTARGELVDTGALIEALRSGRVGAAGLDVVEGEDLLRREAEEHLLDGASRPDREKLEQSTELGVLLAMPNVILTPHNAFNSVEAVGRINSTTAENIRAFLAGNPTNVVKPAPIRSGRLTLVRHGESVWNALGKWTGTRDVHLTEQGFKEAARLGVVLGDLTFDHAYASRQIRTFETLQGILNVTQQFDVPCIRARELNERDYGIYTGKNKWRLQQELGEATFHRVRREWDYPVPGGETMKEVYARVQPYYLQEILPKLQQGKNVLVVSHGNALRALIKYLESISDEGIGDVEMLFGEALIYDVDADGRAVKKPEHRAIEAAQQNMTQSRFIQPA